MPADPHDDQLSPVSHTREMLVREVREADREADFVASDETIDSYGDIVEQVWNLKRFLSNPVILFAHNSRELTIGQATRCEVVGKELVCTIRFASKEANPKAENVWLLVKEKAQRAVSVGFNPGSIRYEKRDGREVCILSDNELYEISVTPIGANPNALAKMRAKALAAREGPKEKTMNETEKKALEDLLATSKAQAEVMAKMKADLEAEKAARLESEKALHEKVKAAEVKSVHAEIDGLVGKRLFPFEVEDMKKLASLDLGLEIYRSMMKKREEDGAFSKLFGKLFSKAMSSSAQAEKAGDDGSEDLATMAQKGALAEREDAQASGGGDDGGEELDLSEAASAEADAA